MSSCSLALGTHMAAIHSYVCLSFTCAPGCCLQDSDDEVLVSLEDVLAPHPEDLLDPETYHLHSQLTHAGSGCMVMSHAGCPIAAGADMPLETRLSGFQGLVPRPDVSLGPSVTGSEALAGMLLRYASSVAAQHQHQGKQQQQEPVQAAQQQLQQQSSLRDALPSAAAGWQLSEGSPPLAMLCESPKPTIEQRFTFATPSPAAAAGQQSPRVCCSPLLDSDAGAASTAPGADADSAALSSSGSGQANRRTSREGSARRSSSCDAPASSSSRTVHSSTTGARPGASSSSGSILSASAPLFSFRSEAAALAGTLASNSGGERATAGSAAEPSRQLLRTISNSNHRRNAGALAAAGLLQMSPGLFLTTPPLLGKLLSKKTAGFQMQGSSAAAAAAQYHHGRGPSHDSLASWEFSQLSVSSAAAADQQQQLLQRDPSGTCLTAQSRAGSWGGSGQPASAGSVWPSHVEHCQGSGGLGSWGANGDAAAAATFPLVPSSSTACEDPAACSHVHLGSDLAALRVLSPAAARLTADVAVSIGSSPAVAASPVGGMPGGFGKILVRRRFARNLQPVALTIKRWVQKRSFKAAHIAGSTVLTHQLACVIVCHQIC
jgi:hypothetical protein